jgi:hypothetical protein
VVNRVEVPLQAKISFNDRDFGGPSGLNGQTVDAIGRSGPGLRSFTTAT